MNKYLTYSICFILIICFYLLVISLVDIEKTKYYLSSDGGKCTMHCLGGTEEYYCQRSGKDDSWTLSEIYENSYCFALKSFEGYD